MWRKIKPFELAMLFACSFYLYYALKIPYGTIDQPGPGFFPIVLGTVGLVISLVLVIGNILNVAGKQKLKQETPENPESPESQSATLADYIKQEEADDGWQATAENKRKFISIIFIFVLFIVSMEIIGAPIGLVLLTMVLCKIYGMRGWLYPLITGACSSVSIYLVFSVIFKISLPDGLLLSLFL